MDNESPPPLSAVSPTQNRICICNPSRTQIRVYAVDSFSTSLINTFRTDGIDGENILSNVICSDGHVIAVGDDTDPKKVVLSVYDLSRGVRSGGIDPKDEFMDACCSEEHIYILSLKDKSKLIAYVYDMHTLKIIRKIKGCGKVKHDKTNVGCRIAASSEHMMVCDGRDVRLVDLKEGSKGDEKLHLDKLLKKGGYADAKLHSLGFLDGVLFVCAGTRLYVIDGGSMKKVFQVDLMDSPLQHVTYNEHYVLITCAQHAFLLHRASSFSIASALTLQDDDCTLLGGAILDQDLKFLLLQNGQLVHHHLSCRDATASSPTELLIPSRHQIQIQKLTDIKEKRKEPTSAIVLGPADAGVEQLQVADIEPPSKKSKQDQPEEEPSIADRLDAMRKYAHDSPEEQDDKETEELTPSTIDASTLLKQCLASNDDATLEKSILAKRNQPLSVIHNTLSSLDTPIQILFLEKLISKIQKSPARLADLAPWLRTLFIHISKRESREVIKKDPDLYKRFLSHVHLLQNLFRSRVAMMDGLLSLQGRLELIGV